MGEDDKILVKQEQALSLFLESLLRETEQTEVEQGVETVTEVETQTEEKVVVAEPEVKTDTEIESETTTPEAVVVSDAVYTEPFQAMLFEVAGLKLAIPLVELSGVLEWSDEITEMPGHADFYLGLMQHLGKSIPVIDTARVVFPPDKLAELVADDPRNRIKRIVLIDDSRWGLGCDRVDEVVELTPDQVKWRPASDPSANPSRQWLAGTVIEQMCALINGKGFSKLLKTGQK